MRTFSSAVVTAQVRKSLAATCAVAVTAVGLGFAAVSDADAASFTYSYGNPYAANAQTYIHSTSNISLYTEGTVRLWKPNVGASTFAGTVPGVITYNFDFGTNIVGSAFLRTNNPTFHWSYSQGHNFFYGSKDGVNWEQLLDVTPPPFASANSGGYNAFLPSSLLGGSELWFKAELYSYGSRAGSGGVFTNTAQHSRWDTGQGPNAETFKLEVDFATAVVPLPASFPLLAGGLGLMGLVGWRRKRKAASSA